MTGVTDPLPLTGIRVLDLTSGLAGPVATRLLAEAGAEVVKVEPPAGDTERARPASFATWNRGKRSVVLDLDAAGGPATLAALARRADVVVHDFPADRARVLGLRVDSDHALELPGVIIAGVPAYPVGHPLEDVAASDAFVQATEGFMDEQQGNRPGPIYIRLPFPSWCAAYLLAAGVVARLVQRERTGVVLPVDTSLLQGGLAPAALYWQRWDRLPATLDKHTLPKIWPDAALSIFPCADGRWVQLAGAVGGWIESPPVLESLALMNLVDLSELGVTPENRATWNTVFETRTSAEWLERFSEADVPCMPLLEPGECFTTEQASANQYVVEVDDPTIGEALQAASPVQLGTAASTATPAPTLGSSTIDEVLSSWTPRGPAESVAELTDPRPLAGLRALDFGSVVAGPFGAQCLADLGADVVKVEPIAGDRGRTLTQFAGCHRGKRSIAVDLKSDQGREIVERLVATSDVVLHNMRLGPAGRLGIDLDGLRSVNADIVFSHVSAYGAAGPMAGHPGYDPTAQAFTGWELANAGEGGDPIWLRNSVFDVQAGLAACLGALLGLVQRERTGRPGHAATSLLAVGITAASEVVVGPDGAISPWRRVDQGQHGLGPARRLYRASDGWILVDARDDHQERVFTEWVGGDLDLAEEVIGRRSSRDVLDDLGRIGVVATVAREDQQDTFLSSGVHRRLGLARRLETLDFGRLDVVAGFWDPETSPHHASESIPALGEHSTDLLRELRYSSAAVDELVAAGAVKLVATRIPA